MNYIWCGSSLIGYNFPHNNHIYNENNVHCVLTIHIVMTVRVGVHYVSSTLISTMRIMLYFNNIVMKQCINSYDVIVIVLI